MKKIGIALILAALTTTGIAAEEACSVSNPAPVTELDIGKSDNFSWRFCNNLGKKKVYENFIVTSDGGLYNRREMNGFVVKEIIEIDACKCIDLLVQRDPDEALENEAGFFWLNVEEVEPSISRQDNSGNIVQFRVAMMPVVHYGNDISDKSNLAGRVENNRLIVSNSGKRPGRIVGIKIGGDEFTVDKYFVMPGKDADITRILPASLVDILATKKTVVLIDSTKREIPVI